MAKRKVAVFGPGPQFKGGMANYTLSLAKSLDALPNTKVHLLSWTQQYPAVVPRDFIDRSSKEDKLAGTGIQLQYLCNYNNPLTWQQTVAAIRAINPDMLIIQWSIAIQGLPLGWMVRRLKKHSDIEVLFDLHFVVQKEESRIDWSFSRYGLSAADSYIVHSMKTFHELEDLFPKKSFYFSKRGERSQDPSKHSILWLYHPVYDMFRPDENFDVEAFKQAMGLREKVFLFFGFIRKYKGLHRVIRAFEQMARGREDVSLLIVGESFWNTLDSQKLSTRLKKAVFGGLQRLFRSEVQSEKDYQPLALIDQLGIGNKTVVVNDFVPNEDVHKYFQASDVIMLYYEYATPSGVESMAYNFRLPVCATRVGHFPETVKPGYNGYLASPESLNDMAEQMRMAADQPIDRQNVAATAAAFSWDNYARTILGEGRERE